MIPVNPFDLDMNNQNKMCSVSGALITQRKSMPRSELDKTQTGHLQSANAMLLFQGRKSFNKQPKGLKIMSTIRSFHICQFQLS